MKHLVFFCFMTFSSKVFVQFENYVEPVQVEVTKIYSEGERGNIIEDYQQTPDQEPRLIHTYTFWGKA
ncbi:MAG: hypothetical protein AAFY71_20215 [Bacteroidota bacterium]